MSAPRAVLIGLPASGKTTVARAIAHMLDLPHCDSDVAIEEKAGTSVQEIFAHDGEARFRELEAEVISELLRTDCILSLGGGAVSSPRVRAMLKGHTVIFLDVDHQVALRRIRNNPTARPLLMTDPEETFARLAREREPSLRAMASYVVHSGKRPARVTAEKIIRYLETIEDAVSRIQVGGERPYPVIIAEDGAGRYVREFINEQASQAVICYAPALAERANALAGSLRASAGLEIHLWQMADAEKQKSISAMCELWDFLGQCNIGRKDVLIALGGGATTDAAGFAAATWLRGIDLINVPTTVLGMVDAAVGGKTGINCAYGKNLIGSFYPPRAVVCTTEPVSTLPVADIRAGLAEVIKCGFIADTKILDLVAASSLREVTDPHSEVLRELIERAIAVKAKVVSHDLRESGLREILNYGHTYAHAIERSEDYRWRHGDAVAVGCVYAATLAELAGVAEAGLADHHREILRKVGLPVAYHGADFECLRQAMGADKKVRAGQLRFVVLSELGNPQRLENPDEDMLARADQMLRQWQAPRREEG